MNDIFTKIFKDNGLDTVEVEDNVYQVNNIESEINVDKLQSDLKSCILIASPRIRYKKDVDTGINDVIAHIYYIITDYDADNLMLKYKELSKAKIDTHSLIRSYQEDDSLAVSVDTIYSAEELGRR